MAKLISSYAAYQKIILSEGLYSGQNSGQKVVAHNASHANFLILTVKMQDIFEPLSLPAIIPSRLALHEIGVATKLVLFEVGVFSYSLYLLSKDPDMSSGELSTMKRVNNPLLARRSWMNGECHRC